MGRFEDQRTKGYIYLPLSISIPWFDSGLDLYMCIHCAAVFATESLILGHIEEHHPHRRIIVQGDYER